MTFLTKCLTTVSTETAWSIDMAWFVKTQTQNLLAVCMKIAEIRLSQSTTGSSELAADLLL